MSFFSLDLLSTTFCLLFFHFIPAPYLNIAISLPIIVIILFFIFSFDISTNRSLRLYSFIFFFFFHFISFDLIQFNYSQICVSFLFDLLHYFTIWELYSFTFNYFSVSSDKNSALFLSKPHPNISTKFKNTSHKCIHLFFTLRENNFKSFINNK